MGLEKFYHGSTYTFDNIDISKEKPYKDFGPGFYTTKRRLHAESIAKRNNKYLICKGTEYLYTYGFDKAWFKQFNTKIFKVVNIGWIDFVLKNRNSPNKVHEYEIVKGPTADENTRLCLTAYSEGLYGLVGSYRSKEYIVG